MASDTSVSLLRVMGVMALFVILGSPLVGYLWETINQLLALEVDGTRVLISIPVLALLIVLLVFLTRAARRLQEMA